MSCFKGNRFVLLPEAEDSLELLFTEVFVKYSCSIHETIPCISPSSHVAYAALKLFLLPVVTVFSCAAQPNVRPILILVSCFSVACWFESVFYSSLVRT